MSVKFSDDPLRAHDPPAAQGENVHWLPRSRLRSGGRGDRMMTGLTMLTAAVLAAAAGVAVWSRHGDLVNLQMFASDKAAERAPVASPPPAPVARAVTPAAPSVAGQPGEAQTEAPAPAARAAIVPEPATTVRTTPDDQPIDPPIDPAPQRLASAPEPAAPEPQKPVFEPVPPIPLSSSPSASPAAPVRSPPAQALEIVPPAPPPAPERAVAASNPAPPRAAAPSPAPSSAARPAARMAIYLDEYPDQKAAAAGLSQKSGAYGKFIGSAGKLTYTRRNGNSWRLRVSNLDQATAEALCAKLKGAGSPCSVGPN